MCPNSPRLPHFPLLLSQFPPQCPTSPSKVGLPLFLMIIGIKTKKTGILQNTLFCSLILVLFTIQNSWMHSQPGIRVLKDSFVLLALFTRSGKLFHNSAEAMLKERVPYKVEPSANVWGYYRRNLSLEGVYFTMRSCRLKALICNKKILPLIQDLRLGAHAIHAVQGLCRCSLRLILETSQAAEFGILSILLI